MLSVLDWSTLIWRWKLLVEEDMQNEATAVYTFVAVLEGFLSKIGCQLLAWFNN